MLELGHREKKFCPEKYNKIGVDANGAYLRN